MKHYRMSSARMLQALTTLTDILSGPDDKQVSAIKNILHHDARLEKQAASIQRMIHSVGNMWIDAYGPTQDLRNTAYSALAVLRADLLDSLVQPLTVRQAESRAFDANEACHASENLEIAVKGFVA